MQNKELKNRLCAAFDAPQPRKKQAFLRQFPAASISCGQFLRMQLRWLPFGAVALSVAVCTALIVFCRVTEPESVWTASAFAPFLTLGVLSVRYRSFVHGMEELEFAARFSLKSVTLARMGALALLDLALLLCAALLLRIGGGVLRTGLALLLPYCTTVCIALPLTRRWHGWETPVLCIATAAVVCCGVLLLRRWSVALPTALALLLIAAELALIVFESAKFIRQTEELTWNCN